MTSIKACREEAAFRYPVPSIGIGSYEPQMSPLSSFNEIPLLRIR